MKKRIFKIVVIILLVAIMLFWFTKIDWSNLLSRENSGALLGVLAPLLILIALQLNNKESKK